MPSEFLREALRNRGALTQYLNGKLPTPVEIDRHIYVGVRERHSARPDHLIKNQQSHTLGNTSSVRDLLIKTFDQLSNLFLARRANAHYCVEADKFADWQNIITEISPLTVVTWKLLKDCGPPPETPSQQVAYVERHLAPQMRYSALPTVSDPRLDDLIVRQGLDDLHIHLNGSSEVELVWRDALSHPFKFAHQFKEGIDKKNVAELFEQEDPSLNHTTFLERLAIANNLRFLLFKKATGLLDDQFPLYRALTSENLSGANNWNIKDEFQSLSGLTPLLKEALFLMFAFNHLKDNATTNYSHALYAYLLIKAQFFRLLVQQTHQFGFDQFQKITDNEIREMTEKDHKNRYHQLEYTLQGDIDVLEGRFAPNQDNNKNYDRIKAIMAGYVGYHQEKQQQQSKSDYQDPKKLPLRELLEKDDDYHGRIRLSLVAHFIKKKDKQLEKLTSKNTKLSIWSCRHFGLRQELDKTHRRLKGLQKVLPNLSNYLSGFDAAANELHASPEVFAPLFRRLRGDGHHNFTFHAGEDFVHLLSGIRYVYEAIIFLEMEPGNRIGHGTAVGIDPDLWRKRIGDTVVMSQGDRLDDLVIARTLLLSQESYNLHLMHQIESEIFRLCRIIYNTAYTPELLYEAWKLRKLDPVVAFDLNCPRKAYLRVEFEQEIVQIKQAENDQPDAFEIFKHYHEAGTVSKAKILIRIEKSEPIEVHFTKSDFRSLQKRVLKEINDRRMAIEVLPTSNLRISFYNKLSEHHIFSWLGLKEPGMSVPVCLGSDDPGIFSTNLRNEYAHILNELDRECGAPIVALGYLEQLVKNGKIWRFRKTSPRQL